MRQRQVEKYQIMAEKLAMMFGFREAVAELRSLEQNLEETYRSQERLMKASSVQI